MVASNLDIKNMRDRGLFNDTCSEKLQNKFNTRIVKMKGTLHTMHSSSAGREKTATWKLRFYQKFQFSLKNSYLGVQGRRKGK